MLHKLGSLPALAAAALLLGCYHLSLQLWSSAAPPRCLDGSSGKLRSFNIADLSAHSFAASPMPALGNDWNDQDIADLVAYLASLRAPAKGATP